MAIDFAPMLYLAVILCAAGGFGIAILLSMGIWGLTRLSGRVRRGSADEEEGGSPVAVACRTLPQAQAR